MDRIVSSSHDRTSLLSTHKVLRNTYFLLSLTLAFSAITATASTVLMLPSPGLILTLVGMYGLMFLTYKRRISRPGLSPHSPLPVFWVISSDQF
ncbi:putative carrier/transport protein [Shigella flexneri]|nr:putative carrier/transport protein [Shigella flexneri]